ncbi:MAG TPA: MarR family transcriptional regulator [Archangium sp.]|nr:MarR family transcriptional regulator [Archangium sp.]
MTLDLEMAAPEDVAFRIPLDDILAAVRSRKQWSERMAQVLEYAYCERLLKLVRTGAPIEQFRELNEHLAQVVHPVRRAMLEGLDKPYFTRWSLLRALLEMRIESLRSELPQHVLEREHVRDILARVRKAGELSQQQLGEELGLGKANLSRILSLMEANELIDKLPRGSTNLITLGVRGRELAPPPPLPMDAPRQPPGPRVTERRGSSYFSEESDLTTLQ